VWGGPSNGPTSHPKGLVVLDNTCSVADILKDSSCDEKAERREYQVSPSLYALATACD